MATLHEALKRLGPVDFSEIPTDPSQLDKYVTDLFTQAELILESIPIPAPTAQDPHKPHIASNASEITPSTERSQLPAPEPAALQKEWGKPVKIGAKENPLAMSVYKLSGKDSRGAWFARRSVHEGIGFARFKEGLEMEFEQSMAVEGPAGAGNIRGIGGETRVESIQVPGKGKVEVYRLSAQFPGPTTPRDFVTLLVTSDTAMSVNENHEQDKSKLQPRHYMIISNPCNHPQTQPQDGFVRGSYESVEFIREVPRKLTSSVSTTNLLETGHQTPVPVGKEATIRNAHQRTQGISDNDAEMEIQRRIRSASEVEGATQTHQNNGYNPEHNPVEWIMVTRSDPGGSVPRFMVERGTPGSICADAKKFLDWACQRDLDGPEDGHGGASNGNRRPDTLLNRTESHQSWRGSRVAGLEEEQDQQHQAVQPGQAEKATITQEDASEQHGYGGVLGAVAGTLSAFTPQVVLDRLPQRNTAASPTTIQGHHQQESIGSLTRTESSDTESIKTAGSFASANDHVSSDESEKDTLASTETTAQRSKHEIELQKLEERRTLLTSKFADNRTKLEQQVTEQTAKDEAAHQKAIKKHEKELAKHEEKYQKEFKKLEEKQEKERRKLQEKQKKQADKDDKTRLTRERDEARSELDLARKDIEVLKKAVDDLQKENNRLVSQLGNGGNPDGSAVSRSSSLKKAGTAGNGVGNESESPRTSLKGVFTA